MGKKKKTSTAAVVPVEKNGIYEADVIGIGHEGEGVGRVQGFTLFIHGALPGEKVRVKVLKVKKSFGYAKLLEVLDTSPDRTAPPCPIYESCGGCQLQHLDYAAQLRYKRQTVVDQLERIGKLQIAPEPDMQTEVASNRGQAPPELAKSVEQTQSSGQERQHLPTSPDRGTQANRTAKRCEKSDGYSLGNNLSKIAVDRDESLRNQRNESVSQSESKVEWNNRQEVTDSTGQLPSDDGEATHASVSATQGVIVHATLGMDHPWRYRNKAQVPIGEMEGGLVGGFYARSSHRIIDMESCGIQHEANDEVVQAVKAIGTELGVSAYDERTHQGVLRHVVVRRGFHTGEVMVVLITSSRKLPQQERWIAAIRERVSGVQSICHNVNRARTNVIFGEHTNVLWGRAAIYDDIGGVRFAISARSFYQVNPVQTEVLYRQALRYAQLTGTETVIDAYCGIGTISLFLARAAKKVYGVEIVPEAVEDARANAELNGIGNVEFAVGEAEAVLPQWREAGVSADVAVVDPPRKGCDAALLETLLAMRPARIVYVSCNPATLARDLRILADGGYRAVEVQPVDMFPHTVHIEAVVSLVYKGLE